MLARSRGFATTEFTKMVDSEGLVGTNFEKKYIAQGRTFFAAARLKYLPPTRARCDASLSGPVR